MEIQDAFALISRRQVRVGADTETHLTAACKLAPPLVCLTGAIQETTDGPPTTGLWGNGDKGDDGLDATIEGWLDDPNQETVFHNAPFDVVAVMESYPHLIPKLFTACEEGRIRCTIIREKLLNLALVGGIDYAEFEDGVTKRLAYSLGDLEYKYFQKRRADKVKLKKATGDEVRFNYDQLDGYTAASYPAEFRDYAMEDSASALAIANKQDHTAAEALADGRLQVNPFATEALHVCAGVALYLASAYGVRTDPERHAKVAEEIAEKLRPEKMQRLLAAGILRPPIPPRPRANSKDGSGALTKGVKESRDMKKLRAWVEQVAARVGYTLKKTKGGEGDEISTEKDVIEDLAAHDETLAEYRDRQKNQKMVTTDLPRMSALVVHPSFDVLKETGRTSSHDSDGYPSMNIQNPHTDARQIIVPRDGWLLFSVDYSSLELVTLAQKCLTLFGQSVLADALNAGIDPHAYLGAQLCQNLQMDFRQTCERRNLASAPAVYEAFNALKTQECQTHGHRWDEGCTSCASAKSMRAVFAHYRKFAKPTGLGYPGGLGPDTFIYYAKKTYKVVVDRETAVLLKRIWLETYPEMVRYFEWVNSACHDPHYPRRYAYYSPWGMYRANTTFCAVANGAALQTPAAEGAKWAFYRVMREAYDPTMNSCLYGAHPTAFIHDEIFGEVPEDNFAHERVLRVGDIMVESMRLICPDVKVKANPALMRRWDKKAEPVYGADGRLIVWTPEMAA